MCKFGCPIIFVRGFPSYTRLTDVYLMLSYLQGSGNRSGLGEFNLRKQSLPTVADIDFLIKDCVRDDPLVLCQTLHSQDSVLGGRTVEG